MKNRTHYAKNARKHLYETLQERPGSERIVDYNTMAAVEMLACGDLDPGTAIDRLCRDLDQQREGACIETGREPLLISGYNRPWGVDMIGCGIQ